MHGFFDFLSNPLVLTITGILWGLWIKYNPKAAGWPNAAIPYLNALLAFIAKFAANATAGGDTAHAVFTPVGLAVTGFGGTFIGSILMTAASAGWQAIQNALIYEVFLRHPIKATGIEKQPAPLR